MPLGMLSVGGSFWGDTYFKDSAMACQQRHSALHAICHAKPRLQLSSASVTAPSPESASVPPHRAGDLCVIAGAPCSEHQQRCQVHVRVMDASLQLPDLPGAQRLFAQNGFVIFLQYFLRQNRAACHARASNSF